MDFEPYEIPIELDGFKATFLVQTQEAKDWYDPIKPYTALEYQWVQKNIYMPSECIIDGGCHHGHYSTIFNYAAELICVDANIDNIFRTEKNLELNNINASMMQVAISATKEMRRFSGHSNGHLVKDGGIEVHGWRLIDIMDYASVIKLDIEGAEFEVLPDAVDDMYQCHTWIVEAHPNVGNPSSLVSLFMSRGFDVLHVNRHLMKVVDVKPGTVWDTQSTIIARRA